MRRPRLKVNDTAVFYHLYNRVAGEPGFFPFGPAEKEHFLRLLRSLDSFFTVRVVAYQVMSNHFHLIAHVPAQPPSPDEVCRRYKAYYRGRRTLEPSDPRCVMLGRRMRDISWYMQVLEQQFTRWYNRTRPKRRRGALWAERFKHTLLGDARAVWECWKYLEMNPVRAHLVSDPATYRFSSYGAWSGRGRPAFEENLRAVLLPALQEIYPFQGLAQIYDSLRQAFAELRGVEVHPDGKLVAFTIHLDRRVRYWVDGLVIGSDLFIRNLACRYEGILRTHCRAFTQAKAKDQTAFPLCCYKQLRSV
jgi:REP element-mobilizing transposase RayT